MSSLLMRRAFERAGQIAKNVLAMGFIASGATLLTTSAYAAAGPTVQTDKGAVQGFVQNGVDVFLGVPYAAPPTGSLRWRPPTAHQTWSSTLKATSYAPICAQITTLGVFAGPANNNEDCLYLNVFTPNPNPANNQRLPVIFWIHGGGNVDGETPGYDGTKMAADGHTVVVTVEYRLNLMGWLAHPALDQEGHNFGNYGILDQQFALKWVKNNIAKFGGDPTNVTVGGQSAGAEDTGIAMLSPLAKGLFSRGLCESFCPSSSFPTLQTAEAAGIAFAKAAGCGSGTGASVAACLRALPASKVEQLAGTASATSAYVLGPMVDGTVIPTQPLTAYSAGQFNHVPLMNGNVEDEENFSLAITEFFESPRQPLTAAQYESFVNTAYAAPTYPAGTAQKVLNRYPLSAYASPQLAWDRVGTDSGICPERALDQILAPQIPLYAYEFDDQTAPFYFPKMPGFLSLAYHTADIQYLFPGWSGGPDGIQHSLNNKQENLSNELVAAWTNFAWTGNPNGQGNTPWPLYPKGKNKAAWFIENLSTLSTLTDKQYNALRNCDFWDKIVASKSQS
jgi:para-nitrobenzyl esterase